MAPKATESLDEPSEVAMPSTPTISVVVRTLNEEALVGDCLRTLLAQAPDLDIVVVDSGSTDRTVEIVRALEARVLEIDASDFDFSTALNRGIEVARGQYVVIVSAHSIPRETDWLKRMLAPFAEPSVAGVCCRQVPWPDADWNEVIRIRRMFPRTSRVFDDPTDEALVFSNAASCIRRSVWEEKPFTLPAAEDLDWAQRILARGWKVVYEASASAYHSHADSPKERAVRLVDLFHANDVRTGRNRSLGRTTWQAGGIFYRDFRKIAQLDEPRAAKLRHLLYSLRVAGHFVRRFAAKRTTR